MGQHSSKDSLLSDASTVIEKSGYSNDVADGNDIYSFEYTDKETEDRDYVIDDTIVGTPFTQADSKHAEDTKDDDEDVPIKTGEAAQLEEGQKNFGKVIEEYRKSDFVKKPKKKKKPKKTHRSKKTSHGSHHEKGRHVHMVVYFYSDDPVVPVIPKEEEIIKVTIDSDELAEIKTLCEDDNKPNVTEDEDLSTTISPIEVVITAPTLEDNPVVSDLLKEEEVIEVTGVSDLPEEEEVNEVTVASDLPEEEEDIEVTVASDIPEEEEVIEVTVASDLTEEEEVIEVTVASDLPERVEVIEETIEATHLVELLSDDDNKPNTTEDEDLSTTISPNEVVITTPPVEDNPVVSDIPKEEEVMQETTIEVEVIEVTIDDTVYRTEPTMLSDDDSKPNITEDEDLLTSILSIEGVITASTLEDSSTEI